MSEEPKKTGFAAMSPEKQREIASRGGKAAHERGAAHQFTSADGRVAGRKGGAKVSEDIEHMREIGRLGGLARGRKAGAPEVSSLVAPSAGDQES